MSSCGSGVFVDLGWGESGLVEMGVLVVVSFLVISVSCRVRCFMGGVG